MSRPAAWADIHPGVLTAKVLAACGGRVGTRRETTELGSERLPAGSVELRSPDFADQLPFDGVAGDRLAAGETGRAADLLAQRFKAVELSLHDGDWSRATHLELLPPSGRHLTSREEETLVAKELRDEMRVKRYFQRAGPAARARAKGEDAAAGHHRNGSVRRERGAERERSRDGKRDKEKDQKKGGGKRRGRK